MNEIGGVLFKKTKNSQFTFTLKIAPIFFFEADFFVYFVISVVFVD